MKKKMMYGGTKKKKAGGLKEPKPNQKGLKKLPTAVRNKMGYMQDGGKKKAASDSTKTEKPLNYPGGPNNPFVDEMSVVGKAKKDTANASKKKAPKKKMMGGKKKMMNGGKKKMMGGKKMMYKSGGFLEMPVFDLDRD